MFKLNPFWRIFIIHWLLVGGGYCLLYWLISGIGFDRPTPSHLIFQFIFFGGGMSLAFIGISKSHLLNKRHSGFPSADSKHSETQTIATQLEMEELQEKISGHFDTSEAIFKMDKNEIDLLIQRHWFSLGNYFKVYKKDDSHLVISYACTGLLSGKAKQRYEAYAEEIHTIIQPLGAMA